MVIGNGLIANTFPEYRDDNRIVIFASGVSNSIETNEYEFNREFDLLKETVKRFSDKKLVYFSTCSIEDAAVNERPYVKHKIEIESYIERNVIDFLIFRVTNVVGLYGNSNTIMNYFVHAIHNQIPIDVWKYSERNLIDRDDLKFIIEAVIQSNIKNETINVALRKSILVTRIIELIENHLSKKANMNLIEKGCSIDIDTSKISQLLDAIELNKGIGSDYINGLLNKYYKL